MFYSSTTGGFYSEKIHGNNIPSDSVEINNEKYIEIIESQSQGKIIKSDKNGHPIVFDRPTLSIQELGSYIRRERNIRVLCAIDAKSKYEREQESIARSIQVSNPMLESDYALVLQYLQDLFDVPQQEGFPWNGPEDPLCPWPTKPDCVCDTSIV